MSDLPGDRTARPRRAGSGDVPHGGPGPDAGRDLAALTREKQLAVVGLISAYIHSPDMGEDLVADLVAEFLPTVDDRSDSGAAAVQNAYMNVIAHLLGELAHERGEPAERVWQRAAVELMMGRAR
ncbi:hypothetical protein [Planomonospora venezuelensis]|uniref:Uncharacterized protein n=1 Tax=Planomonospora venezuelensis TaxID=1999 RepID=A0A841CVN6_PLAVE|nr:hypothetical protein [Planomonospora venezuelensis]MBB5962452.1 hypothetical protein [Planomonospora venezuelensis]GIN00835.1 hypothetical protein Pve01_24930 [Planomonospora venezuelensis]